MNKKVSTLLTVALALGGSLLTSSAFAQETVKELDLTTLKASDPALAGWYYVSDAAHSYYLSGRKVVNADATTNSEVKGKEFTTVIGVAKADLESKGDSVLFKIVKTEVEGRAYFTLKNKATGAEVKFKKSTNDAALITGADTKTEVYTYFSAIALANYSSSGATIVPNHFGGTENTQQLKVEDAAGTSNRSFAGTGSNFVFNSADVQPYDAEALNELFGGEGFSLVPTDLTVEENPFAADLKAFDVNIKDTQNKVKVSGTFFATSYPEELADKNEIGNDEYDLFEKCEFVVLASNETFETTKFDAAKGEGFKFTTVSGASLNASSDPNNAPEGTDIYVGNGAFTVTEPDFVNAEGKLQLALADVKVLDLTDKDKKKQVSASVYATVTTISGTNVVTSVSTATSAWKVGTSKQETAINLLKKENAPSAYTIQFVSGEGEEDSEYNKYLGVVINNANNALTLAALGNSLVDLSLPQYQFVISDIDTKENTVTFANIEQPNNKFTASLYKTETENVYKVVSAASNDLEIAEDDASGLVASKSMNGKTIKLTPIEIDATAGFVVYPENAEPVTLKFAKTDSSTDKLYLADDLTSTEVTDVIVSDDEDDALLLQFIPIQKKAEDALPIKANYVYNKDGKKYADDVDAVTLFTYYVKVVEDGENPRYLTSAGALVESTTSGNEFIVKKNVDGSVLLIPADAVADLTNSAVALNLNSSNDAVVKTAKAYDMFSTSAVKTYLVGDEASLSFPAKPVHVTMQAAEGGYISMDENNDGKIAIKTEADEDLTFWLDTTASETLTPKFYISKGGETERMFLYNAAREASNAITDAEKEKYVWTNLSGVKAKAIFKAATLVSSDTLTTTIDGKKVTVAAKPDQNKGIVDGIGYFQYSIVSTENEGEYVVRSVEGTNKYLQNVNGMLTWTNQRKDAVRVVVETTEAPTSNESVSATEVKVVANNGSVVVKNAAGKNVVVSTILGQVVANEVLTSDNATINVPAGIVVVAVEGESFKVNVK